MATTPQIIKLSSIRELYQNLLTRCLEPGEKTLVFEFIQKNSIQDSIESVIEQIENLIETTQGGSVLNSGEIKTTSYVLLKKFNEAIKTIEDSTEKDTIKRLLSKLVKGIVIEIHQQAPSYRSEIKKAITDGMEQAVIVEGYDRRDFEQYLQLDYEDIRNTHISVEDKNEPFEYMLWDPTKADLGMLINLLLNDYGCLKSQNDFRTLFNSPDNRTQIKWNPKKTDLLILLFNKLYNEIQCVEIKRGKGLWKIISARFVDFDKNPFSLNFANRLDKLKTSPRLNSAPMAELDQIIRAISK